MSEEKKGMMFVLSSPSGAGKTTLTKKLVKNNSNFRLSISHTTRKPRSSEIEGKDYYFVDENEFNTLISKDEFFEHAKIFDNFYGTLKKPVIEFLSSGKEPSLTKTNSSLGTMASTLDPKPKARIASSGAYENKLPDDSSFSQVI